jgi:hypothetical protein
MLAFFTPLNGTTSLQIFGSLQVSDIRSFPFFVKAATANCTFAGLRVDELSFLGLGDTKSFAVSFSTVELDRRDILTSSSALYVGDLSEALSATSFFINAGSSIEQSDAASRVGVGRLFNGVSLLASAPSISPSSCAHVASWSSTCAFSAQAYKSFYADVTSLTDTQALQHYQQV